MAVLLIDHVPTSVFFCCCQITETAGKTLVSFDISSCQSLTDQSCASIARYCTSLEVLGMRNLRAVTGENLSEFFLDRKRAESFRSITLSGTKNVRKYFNSFSTEDEIAGPDVYFALEAPASPHPCHTALET